MLVESETKLHSVTLLAGVTALPHCLLHSLPQMTDRVGRVNTSDVECLNSVRLFKMAPLSSTPSVTICLFISSKQKNQTKCVLSVVTWLLDVKLS